MGPNPNVKFWQTIIQFRFINPPFINKMFGKRVATDVICIITTAAHDVPMHASHSPTDSIELVAGFSSRSIQFL